MTRLSLAVKTFAAVAVAALGIGFAADVSAAPYRTDGYHATHHRHHRVAHRHHVRHPIHHRAHRQIALHGR